ncbi:MAG: DUF5115 domain-containing protein, partial [Prevotellaceae bacterium]|nr:DUF5115 domain-containing protein [Prevotellaceae bacterium]
MKKIINNYVLCVLNCALCIFLLASCTEDFKDWATPQGNAQGDAINKVAGQVNAFTDNIKYTEAADNINFIEFICADVPEDATIKFTGISVNDAASIPFTSIGNVLRVTKEDLNNAVRDAYHSMSEAEKTLKIKVYGDIIVDGTALYAEMESNEVTINYTPKPLPEEAKETAFYYVGGYNSWDLSPSNQQKLDDNGDGTYSIVLEVGDSEYFKFGPESAVMSSNWDKVLGNEVDGNEAMNGYFVVNGGAMVVANAGTYRFTLDKVNWTYSVTPYTDMLWYAGDANGWTFDPLAKWGSTYVGFYWIDAVDNESTWGFKFPTSNDWDSPCYGAGEGANSIALGGGNILLPDNKAGFYRIDVDTKTNTFAVQEITAMSIIGTVNGSWDTDTDFSWDAEKKAWVCTADLKAGEFKIRANHDWTLSWGGDVTAMTADNGANMVIDEDANYTLIFTPKANGYGTLNIVNNNNVLYYAGDANGWGHDPMQKVGDEYVGYYYIYTTDNSTTWGFKFDPSPDWSKPQYGA